MVDAEDLRQAEEQPGDVGIADLDPVVACDQADIADIEHDLDLRMALGHVAQEAVVAGPQIAVDGARLAQHEDVAGSERMARRRPILAVVVQDAHAITARVGLIALVLAGKDVQRIVAAVGGEIGQGFTQRLGRAAARIAMGKGEPRYRWPHGRGPFGPALEKGVMESILLLGPGLLILPMKGLAFGLPYAVDQVASERPVD